jgi:hypothetical protein
LLLKKEASRHIPIPIRHAARRAGRFTPQCAARFPPGRHRARHVGHVARGRPTSTASRLRRRSVPARPRRQCAGTGPAAAADEWPDRTSWRQVAADCAAARGRRVGFLWLVAARAGVWTLRGGTSLGSGLALERFHARLAAA